jgi:hypothetical protein
LLEAVAHLSEIYSKNVFTLPQSGALENLIALQGSVRLHFDLGEAIIWIFKEEPARTEPNAEDHGRSESRHERDLRHDHQDAAISMPGGLMGTNPDVEKVLLAALPRVRYALVPHPGWLVLRFHGFESRLAAESSMILAQSCG